MKKSCLLMVLLFSIVACNPAVNMPSTSVSTNPTVSPTVTVSSVSSSPLTAVVTAIPSSYSDNPISSSSNNPISSSTPVPIVSASVSANGRLVIPVNFLDGSSIYSDSVSLRWPSLSNAKYFKIYRDNILLLDNFAGNDYLATGLSSSTNYIFSITAINESGESDKFNFTVKTKAKGSSSGGGGSSYSGGSSSQTGSATITGGYYDFGDQ